MDYDKITAKYARKTAQGVLNDKSSYQIETILDDISEAIEEGEMEVISYEELMIETIDELESREFNVKAIPDDNGYTYNIKW